MYGMPKGTIPDEQHATTGRFGQYFSVATAYQSAPRARAISSNLR